MRNYSSSISAIIVDWGNRVNRYELDNLGRVNIKLTPLPRPPRRKHPLPTHVVGSSTEPVPVTTMPIPEIAPDAFPLEPGTFEMDFFGSPVDGSETLL